MKYIAFVIFGFCFGLLIFRGEYLASVFCFIALAFYYLSNFLYGFVIWLLREAKKNSDFDPEELQEVLDILLDIAEEHYPKYSSSDNVLKCLDYYKKMVDEDYQSETK